MFASLLPRELCGETVLRYKYQDYREDADRIRVVSHYGMAELDLGGATRLRARGVLDSITGASPTGQPPRPGSDQVPLARLEDERRAVVADVSHEFGDTTARLEYADSREDDYLSRGWSATVVRSFNRRNTELQLGASLVDDDIQPAFFTQPRRKLTRDFIVGLTQVLGPNTVATANLTWGRSTGYLSDPYKLVQKSVEIAPGFPLPLTFPENRPGARSRRGGYLNIRHFFEGARASLDASYRFFDDNHGIASHTLEFAWLQRVGARLVVRPSLRSYRQGAADYYHPDLDATPLSPSPQPNPTGPFYSSDYRLSAFDATTVALKLIHALGEHWSVDATYERYVMRGRDSITAISAYPRAGLITIGINTWF